MSRRIVEHGWEEPGLSAPIPVEALIFHTGGFATRHPVELVPGGPLLGAGSPFSRAEWEDFSARVFPETRRREAITVLSGRVLAVGSRHLAWYVPGKVAPMWFRAGHQDARFSLVVPWPTLLYVVVERGGGAKSLHLAALGSPRRPGRTSPLFHAPLMNLGDTGQLCTGSVRRPDGLSPADCEAWEAVVTNSFFTHLAGDVPRMAKKSGKRAGRGTDAEHVRVWRSLARERAPRFPSDRLCPMGVTLERFLARVS